jgi:NAD(P)-dependent dehydrogenase (short-subunit alcohol dehydrogenase family)
MGTKHCFSRLLCDEFRLNVADCSFLACRDLTRSQPMLDAIKQSSGNEHVELMQLDLGSFESIRAFAKSFRKKKLPLHYLINNAGSMLEKKVKTADGFEGMVGINHLGPFMLTYELVDILKASAPARIVNLSSDAHRQGMIILFTFFDLCV